jgi:glucose-fructose oxidoreductase
VWLLEFLRPDRCVVNDGYTDLCGSAGIGYYPLIGGKGHLRLDNAYQYRLDSKCVVTIESERSESVFQPSDQFAAELIYFSDCILNNRSPDPSGSEGLADVRVINAIYEAAKTRRSVKPERIRKKHSEGPVNPKALIESSSHRRR